MSIRIRVAGLAIALCVVAALTPATGAFAAESSTTTAVVTPHSAAAGSRVTVRVTVTSSGDATDGTVELQYNRATQAITTVAADGTASFRMTAQNAGKHGAKVTFRGTATAAGSSDTAYYVSKKATSAHVVGHIRDQKGDGIARAGVTAYPVDSLGVAADATTSSSGRFDLKLQPGDYTIRAHRGAANYLDSTTTTLHVTAGTKYRLNKRLQTGAAITGRVSDATGQPLTRIRVDAFGSDQVIAADAVTDPTGAFHLRRLLAGDYTIRFTDDRGVFAEEWFDGAPSVAAATVLHVGTGEKMTGRNAVLVTK